MIDRVPLPRSNRAAALTAVLTLHAAFIILLLTHREHGSSPSKSGAFTVMSLKSAAKVEPKPPPPSLPSKMAAKFQPLIFFSLADILESDAPTGPAGDCSPLDAVSTALQSDPRALAAIRAAPPESRSIANAVVLWNAGWSPVASAPEAPLGAVRTVVLNGLESMGDGCLDEQVVGPRLVPIPDGDGTIFLVFGSGLWTWRDLLLESFLADPLAPAALTLSPAQ